MYFKRLELYGFKSFAEKTVLEFEPGITAIVGPNGCGKSNIADAIKWVLGEQNPRELRGLRMEDVIFNGTSLKEPVNFAEVSLTLSNEDKIFPIEYTEITVTRRLFRSGESEYLLNRVPVRLKDIQELFMGTGIGTSAYSLLEQGKIELILSSRPEDRRFVFEEAAGITKFKAQKKEALRKLEDTENNLIRVNDIISEVNRQLSSLERQARKAERYQEIFNILKEKEIKYSKYLWNKLEDKLKKLVEEKENLQREEKRIIEEISKKEEVLRKRREELENLEKEISLEERNRAQVEASIENNRTKIELNFERIKELEKRNLILEEEIKNLNERIENERKVLGEIKIQFEDFSKSQEEKDKLLKNKRGLLEKINQEIKEEEQLIHNIRIQTMEINQEMVKLRNELVKLRTENSSFQARSRRLEIEIKKAEEEKVKLDNLYSEKKGVKDNKSLELDRKIKSIEDLSINIAKLNQELEDLNRALQEKEVEYKMVSSRIEILEDMKQKYEGYSPGVKSLMLAKKNGALPEAEIIGVLAELIEVDKGYEKAVEAVLGDIAQAVLVKDHKSFSICLEYITRNNLGEVYFIVLEDVDKNGSFAKFGDGFVYLIDFVHIPTPYEPILNQLFSYTLLVKDLAEGMRLRKEKSALPIKLVTYQGEVLDKNFIKTAPILRDEDIIIIGRERRIRDLKIELTKLEEEKNSLYNKRELLLSQSKDYQENLTKAQNDKHALEMELSNLVQEIERIEKDLKEVKDELNLLNLEMEETKEEINSRNEKIKEDEVKLKEWEFKEIELKKLFEETNNKLEENNSLRERTLVEITEIDSELKNFNERVNILKERISSLESSITEAEKMILMRNKEKLENIEKIENLNKEITSFKEESLSFEKGKEEIIKKIEELNVKRIDFKNIIQGEEERLGNLQKDIDNLRKSIYDLDMKIQEIDFNKRDILQRIDNSYKINLETLNVELPSEEFNEEVYKSEIDALREKLSSLGPVNLVAIEEFGQLQERYNFLLSQQADLIKAKESLHEAINKINSTAKSMFIDTFKKVGENFKEIFRLLFGGGNAQLFLSNPEDVLESGIEIVAQPPGKKLQNISLLSGGEKALTAVSLLFAIFKVKPSPFCILDEVDAPLDESNIDRFCMLMKEFSKTSQFIVITHNKKTISVADVMYGVTMEESGVSKLVSVKFSDVPDDKKVSAKKS